METKKQAPKKANAGAPKTSKRSFDKRKIINSVMIVFLSLILVGGVGIFFILNDVLNNSPEYDVKNLDAKEPTRVYSSDDTLVGELGAENRENITYDQIPHCVIDAFLAIEDSRYFSHNGFDLPRFMKSALVNLRAGDFAQGGSTLTMQMIDNSFFVTCNEDGTPPAGAATCIPATGNPIEKVKRKIQEIFMSMQAEKEFTKADIFTKYVNKINFGDNARGIQKGAEYYFGKNIEQITLSEAAFLAGVINLPNTYNPYRSPTFAEDGTLTNNYYEYAMKRRDETLYQMLNHGYITKEEYDLAVSTELAFQLNGRTSFESDAYRDYLDQVYKEVRELTGQDPALIQMDIYTAMDKEAQEYSYDILQGNVIEYPDDYLDVGFAVTDVSNGEIKALGGGRPLEGITDTNWKNQATDIGLGHQPGSSIKPIMDYTPAFEWAGWATTQPLNDTGSVSVFGGTHTMMNSDRKAHGWVNLEKAIAESYNTTAVLAFQTAYEKAGEDKYLDYLHNMGFTQLEYVDANSAIGGGDSMFTSPLQMTGAYSALANGGVYHTPHAVRKVVIRETGEVFENKIEGVEAISPQAAYLMSTVLGNAVTNSGRGSYATLLGRIAKGYPVYGKTGTSDWGDLGVSLGIPEGAMKDLWMVGYTSRYAIATWTGYNNPADTPIKYPSDSVLFGEYSGRITSLLLDLMHRDGYPAAIARPSSGISSITHLARKFPLTAVPSNTPSGWAITGEIKSEFANNLGKVEIDGLSALSSFTSSLKGGTSNILLLNWAAYPDSSKLSDPEENGEVSDVQLYGKVVYKADIKYNGTVIKTVTSSSNSAQESIGGVPDGATLQVCGYYAYSNADIRSAEVCSSVKIPEKVSPPIEEPDDTDDPDKDKD